MRYVSCLVSLVVVALAVFAVLRPTEAEPAPKAEDAWTGTYMKFGEFDTARKGQFGEAQKITITKEGDVYKLSKPFDFTSFKENKKGVLDDNQHLGRIVVGSMEFSDGTRGRVLRADFCYETFYLVADLDKGKQTNPDAPK